MSTLWSSIILAIVQGLTEWLPVSSSGHLVFFQILLNHPGGLAFDVALHFGTLMAVFVYFGREITDILEALLKFQFKSENGRLGLLLLVSSIPAVLVGYFLLPFFNDTLNSIPLLIVGFAITGITMFLAGLDYFSEKKKKVSSFKDSFLIGCAQAIAIIPSISRSGSTLAAGLFLGLDRKAALTFSFLMSIPVIFGANILVVGNNPLSPDLLIATLVSFVIGLASIHFLLKVVIASKRNLWWFGAYSLLLAFVLIIYYLFF